MASRPRGRLSELETSVFFCIIVLLESLLSALDFCFIKRTRSSLNPTSANSSDLRFDRHRIIIFLIWIGGNFDVAHEDISLVSGLQPINRALPFRNMTRNHVNFCSLRCSKPDRLWDLLPRDGPTRAYAASGLRTL